MCDLQEELFRSNSPELYPDVFARSDVCTEPDYNYKESA
mgnify:CR=1 FL=1